MAESKKPAKVESLEAEKHNTEGTMKGEDTINMEMDQMAAKKIQEEFELARQDPTKFVYFPKLPAELRIKIFKAARPEARFIKLEKAPGGRQVGKNVLSSIYSCAKVPSLLQVNRESREIALQWYKLSFGGNSSKVYFDPTADGVLVQCRCYNFMFCKCASYAYELRVHDDLDKIKKMVWQGPLTNHPGFRTNYSLPWVEELIYIRATMEDTNMIAELKMSQLIESPKRAVLLDLWTALFDDYSARVFTAITDPANVKSDEPTSLQKLTRMSIRADF